MQRISNQLAVSKLVLNHHIISCFVHGDQLCDTVIFVVFNPLKPFILGRAEKMFQSPICLIHLFFVFPKTK